MKTKIIIIGIDFLILLLFAGAISYKWYLEEQATQVALVEDNASVLTEIANPFYEVDNSDNLMLLANKVNNIADLNKWLWPTDSSYTITSYYGYRDNEFHNAIDIYSYSGYGSNVYSANNGTIVAIGNNCIAGDTSCNGGKGNYVVVSHNISNYYTLYMHLSNVLVSINQDVSQGDVIGKIGNTGNVSPIPNSSNPYGGTHLHFGVFIGNPLEGGYSINPLSLY
jgi:murein DD-endopeptidase MepM/ murein hydrolase activator NlpD